jgi:hypothetical protein
MGLGLSALKVPLYNHLGELNINVINLQVHVLRISRIRLTFSYNTVNHKNNSFICESCISAVGFLDEARRPSETMSKFAAPRLITVIISNNFPNCRYT